MWYQADDGNAFNLSLADRFEVGFPSKTSDSWCINATFETLGGVMNIPIVRVLSSRVDAIIELTCIVTDLENEKFAKKPMWVQHGDSAVNVSRAYQIEVCPLVTVNSNTMEEKVSGYGVQALFYEGSATLNNFGTEDEAKDYLKSLVKGLN